VRRGLDLSEGKKSRVMNLGLVQYIYTRIQPRDYSLPRTPPILSFMCLSFNSYIINFYFFVLKLPMKMEPIVSSETSAIRTQTPGNYPKRNNLQYLLSVTTDTSCHLSCNI